MSGGESKGWIGRSLLRKEDERHLLGQGQFLADIKMAGIQDIAFVRSEKAHARIRGVIKPDESRDVFTLADLPPMTLLRPGPELDHFRFSPYPALADERVRFVGQPIAACLGRSRAAAEDLADQVGVEYDELPVVIDAEAALAPDAPRLFDTWPDNEAIASKLATGDIELCRKTAPIRLVCRFKMNRQATVALETRGALAYWDTRNDELVVHLSTQGAHVFRHGLAQILGLLERQVRVIAPDVGGGFGGKNRITPEEVAVAALALQRRRPVRWIEDRREHLIASVHARDHLYKLEVFADREGRLLGLAGDIFIDAGAYALWPTSAFMEAGMAARSLPGPYGMEHVQLTTHTVATNKAPMGPYRGVARPGACFAIERAIDEVARAVRLDPFEVRRRNLVRPTQMPFVTAGGLRLDNGDYPACLDKAAGMIDVAAVRARQKRGEPDGRRIGLGFGFYTEQSGHGTIEWTKRRSVVVPGYESAEVRILPDGSAIIHVGVQNHGQGLETTLAQVAAHELTIPPEKISIRYGDTAHGPFGFGTFASRSMVFGGGAVAKASRTVLAKIQAIGAHLLQTQVAQTRIEAGEVFGPVGSVTFIEIARVANVRPEMLPEGMAPLLEATETYEPADSAGVFSYGAHAAVIAVEPETGVVEILDYVVVEDCGTVVNPMIVDGQIIGGVAQGIGTALYEELPFDAEGQPLATSFGEYMVPCATEIPHIRIGHMATPADVTEYGVKGMGEGGAIAPPATLANALCDAFRDVGAAFDETPLTPRRVSNAVAAAAAVAEAAP